LNHTTEVFEEGREMNTRLEAFVSTLLSSTSASAVPVLAEKSFQVSSQSAPLSSSHQESKLRTQRKVFVSGGQTNAPLVFSYNRQLRKLARSAAQNLNRTICALRSVESNATSENNTRRLKLAKILTDVQDVVNKSAASKKARGNLASFALAMALAASAASPASAADPTAVVPLPGESQAQMQSVDPARFNRENWIYSQFIDAVTQHEVERVSFSSDMTRAVAIDVNGNRHTVVLPPFDNELLKTLEDNGAAVAVTPLNQDASGNVVFDLLSSLALPALLIAGLYFLTRRSQGGGGGGVPGFGGRNSPFNMGRTTARFQMDPTTGVTFKDVAGIANAKLELEEVVDFLKDPSRYSALGAKIPRGVILTGPPGTGKTLLAKAVAGEAGVPFFSVSGSEFVEMFVGVGASRVRDLFGQAKQNAPCIIFIDEIDAVGRARSGMAGGAGMVNDEREQTLNQILTEMDGFEGNPGVIIIAATNRVDILDSALLRPGRFDRTVQVDLPDFKERRAILDVHARGKPLSPSVDLDVIARRTPGFSGASLANLLNEAAIFAARNKRSEVVMGDMENALDRIVLGAEKTDRIITDKIKKLVAYHESGHALVGALMKDYDVVQKVTIIPRGPAGGVTFFAPNEERVDSGMYSYSYLLDQLCVALGGRAAEEIVFGEPNVTTGASGDFQQVTGLARRMVTQFGMSKKVGPVRVVYQGVFATENPSPELQKLIDDEVRDIVNNAYERALNLLRTYRNVLDEMANMLMEKETIGVEDVKSLISNIQEVAGSSMFPGKEPQLVSSS